MAIFEFAMADYSHDSAIQRLLRECPMEGQIRPLIAARAEPFCRRPDRRARTLHDSRDARRSRSSRSGAFRSVNGSSTAGRVPFGYLGSLRLDRSCAGRFDILRRGYRFLRGLLATLERSLFHEHRRRQSRRSSFLSEVFQTCRTMSTREIWRPCSSARRPSRASTLIKAADRDRCSLIVDHLNEVMSQFQFAPFWTHNEVGRLFRTQIPQCNLVVAMESERMIACGALWDQRSMKQAVITRYSPHLAFIRPLWNVIAILMDFPCRQSARRFRKHLCRTSHVPNHGLMRLSR